MLKMVLTSSGGSRKVYKIMVEVGAVQQLKSERRAKALGSNILAKAVPSFQI
jgi:hypothetical protein